MLIQYLIFAATFKFLLNVFFHDGPAMQAETVAYAAHCQQEDELDRPVAGHTNICPKSIARPVREKY